MFKIFLCLKSFSRVYQIYNHLRLAAQNPGCTSGWVIKCLWKSDQMDHHELGGSRGGGGGISFKPDHNDSFPRLTAATWRGSCSSSEQQRCRVSAPSRAPRSPLALRAPLRCPRSSTHPLTLPFFSPPLLFFFLFFYPCAPVPVNLNVSVQVEIIHANQRHWLPVLDSQRELSFRRSLVHSCSSHYIFPLLQNYCMYTVTERTQFTATAAWLYLQLSLKGDLPSITLAKVGSLILLKTCNASSVCSLSDPTIMMHIVVRIRS